MSSEERDLEVFAGARLHLRLPDGAYEVGPGSWPHVDVSALPGASMPVRVGFRSASHFGLVLRVVCVQAPSSRWAPGVEELVLERASGIVRYSLGEDHIERLDVVGETARVGPRFEQRFEGHASRGGEEARDIRGKHVLGFAGDARDGILCSVMCGEDAGVHACDELVNAASAEGAWLEAPPPSALTRTILYAAEEPWSAAAIGGATALLAITLVLARRPRPRP